jgi:DNA-directed RNA polymerase subunit beta
LDDEGIVKVGTRVKAGDILVGKDYIERAIVKILPKKNCFSAIFGEKSREVRDTSLKRSCRS